MDLDDPSRALVRAALPRITIQFCTQCKWMLRAAYYAQELLSTFSLSIGEVALQPSTGGTFIITLYTLAPEPSQTSQQATTSSIASRSTAQEPQGPQSSQAPSSQAAPSQAKGQQTQQCPLATVVWDRKTHGGFPETKELKRRVRDAIDPLRDLGHVDRQHARAAQESTAEGSTAQEFTTQQQQQQQQSFQTPARDDDGVQACRDCA